MQVLTSIPFATEPEQGTDDVIIVDAHIAGSTTAVLLAQSERMKYAPTLPSMATLDYARMDSRFADTGSTYRSYPDTDANDATNRICASV